MGGRAVGELLARAAVPATTLALKGGTEIAGLQQLRREIQALRLCFNRVTLHY